MLTKLSDHLISHLTMPGLRRDPALPPPRAAGALVLEVSARREVAEDAVELTLTAPGGEQLPGWEPGCHLDLTLPSGRRRQYSLCGDRADRSAYRIAVRRIAGGGGGSEEVHRDLVPGSTVSTLGPRNAFPFAAEPALLLIAGGIGITPVLPMAREAARRGLDWHLVHTGRSRASMPFAEELAALDPEGRRVTFHCYDSDGYPDPERLLDLAPAADAAVYCCGPAPLLAGVRRAFEQRPLRALHAERFTPPPIVDGRPFTLRLTDGTEVPVPADRSALDALLDARPGTAYSCRQGFCGTCRVRVLSGTPEHRDHRLTDEERAAGDLLICVSRAEEGTCLELEV